jgi:hypothetical protein
MIGQEEKARGVKNYYKMLGTIAELFVPSLVKFIMHLDLQIFSS